MNARFRALNLIMAVVMAIGLVFYCQLHPSQVQCSPAFTNGNIVIYRVGDGSTALATTGNPVFLDEYTPFRDTGSVGCYADDRRRSNKAFFAGGTSTSEGLLTRSTDGNYLLATGYVSTYAICSFGYRQRNRQPRGRTNQWHWQYRYHHCAD